MSNNFVAQELNQCPVCAVNHSVGVLVHKKFKEVKDTVTGLSLCSIHKEEADKGYIHLIGSTNELEPEHGRTGQIISMKRELFKQVMKADPPEHGIAYISKELADNLEAWADENK